jgi:alpha-tubulin suppressor-like RCC1 family protein
MVLLAAHGCSGDVPPQDQLGQSTRNATENAALNAGANAGLNAALNSALNAALNGGTNAALNSALNSALNAAPNSAVNSTLNAAVNSGVNAALNSALNSALNASVNSALNGVTNSAVNAPVNSALNSSVNVTVNSAVTSSLVNVGFWQSDAFGSDPSPLDGQDLSNYYPSQIDAVCPFTWVYPYQLPNGQQVSLQLPKIQVIKRDSFSFAVDASGNRMRIGLDTNLDGFVDKEVHVMTAWVLGCGNTAWKTVFLGSPDLTTNPPTIRPYSDDVEYMCLRFKDPFPYLCGSARIPCNTNTGIPNPTHDTPRWFCMKGNLGDGVVGYAYQGWGPTALEYPGPRTFITAMLTWGSVGWNAHFEYLWSGLGSISQRTSPPDGYAHPLAWNLNPDDLDWQGRSKAKTYLAAVALKTTTNRNGVPLSPDTLPPGDTTHGATDLYACEMVSPTETYFDNGDVASTGDIINSYLVHEHYGGKNATDESCDYAENWKIPLGIMDPYNQGANGWCTPFNMQPGSKYRLGVTKKDGAEMRCPANVGPCNPVETFRLTLTVRSDIATDYVDAYDKEYADAGETNLADKLLFHCYAGQSCTATVACGREVLIKPGVPTQASSGRWYPSYKNNPNGGYDHTIEYVNHDIVEAVDFRQNVCGNYQCESSAEIGTCPTDCGDNWLPTCGNLVCDAGEDCDNCPSDCASLCEPYRFGTTASAYRITQPAVYLYDGHFQSGWREEGSVAQSINTMTTGQRSQTVIAMTLDEGQYLEVRKVGGSVDTGAYNPAPTIYQPYIAPKSFQYLHLRWKAGTNTNPTLAVQAGFYDRTMTTTAWGGDVTLPGPYCGSPDPNGFRFCSIPLAKLNATTINAVRFKGCKASSEMYLDEIGLSAIAAAPRSSQVATKAFHSCAVRTDGAVRCWGDNGLGQLGNGATIDSVVPVEVWGLGSGVAEVGTGSAHTCARKTDGTLWCWGSSVNGELGIGLELDSYDTIPNQVYALGNAVAQLSVGWQHTCAVKTDHTLWCWGLSTYGEIGDGTTNTSTVPVQVTALGANVAAVSAAVDHTCAIKTDGTLWCWGYGLKGELGNGISVISYVPVQVTALGGNVAAVSAGWSHTCARKTDNTLWCWGDNPEGELGNGTTTGSMTPVQVTALGGNVVAMSAGWYHTCARMNDGTLWCWGYNEYGQVGDGSTTTRLSPVQVSALGNAVTDVSVGFWHTCAEKTDGSVLCWGHNEFGQLGTGTVTYNTPIQVTALGNSVAEVASGEDFTCARKTDGTLWCWGSNTSGALGNGTYVSQSTPVQVTTLGNTVAQISVGGFHVCARKTDGTLWCWGDNEYGQLGNGQIGNGLPQTDPNFDWNIKSPIQVPLSAGQVINVSTGAYHTCAVLNNNQLWCWGNDDFGQLGDNTNTTHTSPVRVQAFARTAVQVSGGAFFTCARKTDGSLWCWGRNERGQLGTGSTVNSANTPVQVTALGTTVDGIAAGGRFACAHRTDSTEWCWGANQFGQLGNETTIDSSLPVKLAALGTNVWAGQGSAHACSRRSDGTIWCWGNNAQGQLGDGTNTTTPTPIQVTGLGNNTTQIAVSYSHSCARKSDGTLWCWGSNGTGQLGNGVTLANPTPILVEF